MLLLDDGMTCEATARVLFVDDDTVRTWYQDYQENGIEGLANFGHEGGCLPADGRATGQTEGLDRRDPAPHHPRSGRLDRA